MKNTSGFTLVELLVVVAIIILLAALAIGGLRSSNEGAKKAKALNQIRQLGLAAAQHAADNNGEFPGVAHAGSVTWTFSLRTYLGVNENSSQEELKRVFRSPGETEANRWYSYAINDYLGYNDLGFHRLNQLSSPAQTILFAERNGSYNQDHFHFSEGLDEGSFQDQVAVERYNRGGVYVFADGHAEYLTWEKTQERIASTPLADPGK